MIDLKYILNNREIVKKKLKSRGVNASDVDDILQLGEERSKIMTELQNLEAKRNELSRKIGEIKSKGHNADDIMEKVSIIKSEIEDLKIDESKIVNETNDMLLSIPNLPLDEVPLGKDENDNQVIKEHILGRGKVTNVTSHYNIGVMKSIIDFKRSVKLSGSRFWSYIGDGAKLVRALENFMLQENIENGYKEIMPPVIVSENAMMGTGQIPKFSEDLFKIENSDLYLIPTAEVPLTNFFSGEILDLSSKPVALTAYTPCFRAEAGSGGKDMKGLIRSHQFNKVEIVKIVSEEDKEEEFNKSLNDVKGILEKLELPYQELLLCTGDLGFSAEKTIDLEVWIPSENRYRETSSVSSFGDFQSRRASIRYKDVNNKNKYAHTINGSALAIDRIVAAILENYQNEDGSITIPKVLVEFMNKETI